MKLKTYGHSPAHYSQNIIFKLTSFFSIYMGLLFLGLSTIWELLKITKCVRAFVTVPTSVYILYFLYFYKRGWLAFLYYTLLFFIGLGPKRRIIKESKWSKPIDQSSDQND